MTPSRPATVYTIPPHLPFVDALAAGLRHRFGDSPEALAAVHLLLPNRRACRALTLAFGRLTAGRPLLLPKMTPLGDLDADALAFDEMQAPAGGDSIDIPPAIAPLRRQVLLARRVADVLGRAVTAAQAAKLAAELARLFDQMATERVDPSGLERLVPDDLARHWQVTLSFLRPLAQWWQETLAREGCLDPAERRNRISQAQANAWRVQPPATPVIAAGSTGSVPATADLLDVIARLPEGAVVLPGLDQDADEETWEALSVGPDAPDFALALAHPQFGLARLLRRLGLTRADVKPWPAPEIAGTDPIRGKVLSRALLPAVRADAMRGVEVPPQALDGVTLVEATTPEEEARAIALILRQALEDPETTAALVTPDRGLARRVAAELERWRIAVDDSGGQPLAQTRPATFLRLLAHMVAEQWSPVTLLATLQHPLAAGGAAPASFRRQVRRMEQKLLRGLRPAPGLAGLLEAATGLDARAAAEVAPLLEALEAAMQPLAAVTAQPAASLRALLRAHVAAAEALAATDAQPGAQRLWTGDAGEALAAFIGDLADAAREEAPLAVADFPEVLDVLLADRVVRPAWGRHPRLAIWGPLEARLQRAEVMVLGCLNEETWPPATPPSPWMSRPMMRAFGLPLPERRIGLSAHDFCQAFASPQVWLTRARRRQGAPTVPCRWLLRLQTLLHGGPRQEESLRRAQRILQWQRMLDEPEEIAPAPAPQPRPPVEARPRKLSVTQVETWIRNPFAIYARHVLRLSPLNPLDAEPEAADFGTRVHAALHRFLTDPEAGKEVPLDRLLRLGREELRPLMQRPGVRSFWWPRFERIARWFVQQQLKLQHEVVETAGEVAGILPFEAEGGAFTLTAKADRIDRLQDGTFAIIDYKTGKPPTPKEVDGGSAPQLPLEAAILERGGFAGLEPGGTASKLQYWHLKGDDAGGACQAASKVPEGLADRSLQALHDLVRAFDVAETAYEAAPRPHLAPRFDDYAHLARRQEWASGEEPDD